MPIDETKLTEYALGILADHESRKLKKIIAQSEELQKELREIESTLGILAQAEASITPSPNVRQLILNSTQTETRFSGFLNRFAAMFDLDQQAAEGLMAKIDQTNLKCWESTAIPGVRILKFNGGPKVAAATCGIVQVAPGKLFPAHRHRSEELVLVLQGQAKDDSGNILSAGDRFVSGAGSKHSFRILGDEVFIFAVLLPKNNQWLWGKTLMDHFRVKKNQ